VKKTNPTLEDKLIASSVIGLLLFLPLMFLLPTVINFLTPLLDPPNYDDPSPMGPFYSQGFTGVLLAIGGFIFFTFISNFIGGLWGTNADERSGHGAISGLIVGISGMIIIGLIGGMMGEVSIMQILGIIPMTAGIGSIGGLVGSMSGHQFHVLKRKVVARKRGKS
jgi:hypothetical protein